MRRAGWVRAEEGAAKIGKQKNSHKLNSTLTVIQWKHREQFQIIISN